jgi:phage-related protein
MSTTTPVIFGNILPNNFATNEGQAEAPVVIRIVGSCINPSIENITTNEFIRFKNLTMGAQDELLIDTSFGQKKVQLNGQNVFNKLDYSSSFFNLIKGKNEIEFTDETGSNAATIHFIYKNLYITI